MNENFRDFLSEVMPIQFKEPLAETLGAFTDAETILEYSFIDAIKMAGHVCPTVTGAYLCCQKAVKSLYPDKIPVRGEIGITVYGEADEGVFGVIGHVLSLLTGAAPQTGFRGLGHRFRRKDLLNFIPEKIDEEALCFEFKRLDNKNKVLIKFYPQRVPFSVEKSERMGELLEKVLWEAAKDKEKEEFQDLWMEKVKLMIIEKKEIQKWLQLEERSD